MTNKFQDNISAGSFISKFRMEATRCPKGVSVIFSGIIGVENYSAETVALKSHGAKIGMPVPCCNSPAASHEN